MMSAEPEEASGSGDYSSISDFFDQICRRYGKHPAFSCLGQTLSYQELDRLSAAFAAFLQLRTDLLPGDRIALQLPNLLQYPIALFGALRAGLVVVNTNPLYSAQEMRHQFLDSGVKALLVLANRARDVEKIIADTQLKTVIITQVGDAHAPARRLMINALVRHVKKQVPAYQIPGALDFQEVLKEGARLQSKRVRRQWSDVALLQYTGGTTGVAKGAMLTHGNLVANMLQVKGLLDTYTKPGQEVVVAPLPLYHIYSFTLNCLLMLEGGNHVILIPNPRDIPATVRELRQHRFTLFSGLNTLFLALAGNAAFRQLDFSSLRLTLSGGMALTEEVAREWKRITGCCISEGYGMTETSPIVAVNPPDAIQLGTVGLPVADTQVRIVDEAGSVLPVGGVGELCVKGPQVMAGYWGYPEESAAILDDDGWLRTGDIAQLQEDGYIRLVDRKTDVINVSGFNVYPNEIECVAASHPDIAECVAVGLPEQTGGELIKLFVVSRNPQLSLRDVRDYCRKRLTPYKVPRQIEFCTSLPKNAIGKVLRRSLREPRS